MHTILRTVVVPHFVHWTPLIHDNLGTLTFSLALNFRARSKLKITSIALKPPSVGRYAVLYNPRPPTSFDAQTLRTLPQTTYRRHNCRNDSTQVTGMYLMEQNVELYCATLSDANSTQAHLSSCLNTNEDRGRRPRTNTFCILSTCTEHTTGFGYHQPFRPGPQSNVGSGITRT